MEQEFFISVINRAVYTALLISAPMLIAGLIIGLLISIFQAVTQINEMTLTFIPKILVTFIMLIIFLPWMATTMLDFTIYLFGLFPDIAAGTMAR
jgi:flagellar biosynthetic protein FliQ